MLWWTSHGVANISWAFRFLRALEVKTNVPFPWLKKIMIITTIVSNPKLETCGLRGE